MSKDLDNLLAAIHRDGGHFQAENGTIIAVEEAFKIVGGLHLANERFNKVRLMSAQDIENALRDIVEKDIPFDVFVDNWKGW